MTEGASLFPCARAQGARSGSALSFECPRAFVPAPHRGARCARALRTHLSALRVCRNARHTAVYPWRTPRFRPISRRVCRHDRIYKRTERTEVEWVDTHTHRAPRPRPRRGPRVCHISRCAKNRDPIRSCRRALCVSYRGGDHPIRMSVARSVDVCRVVASPRLFVQAVNPTVAFPPPGRNRTGDVGRLY